MPRLAPLRTLPTAVQALQTQISYQGCGADASCDPRSGVFVLATPELTIASAAPTANADISVPSNGHDVDGAATVSLSRAIVQTAQMASLKPPPASASVGVWSDAAPAPRWITAAALGAGMRWGWTARWMARDLSELCSTPTPFASTPTGIEIRILSAPTPPAHVAGIPYLDAAWEHCLSRDSGSSSGSTDSIVRAAAFKATGDEAVGIVTVFMHGTTSALFDLGVAPSERRKGVGSALVEFATRLAAQRGASSMTLNATPDGVGVYARAGFQDLGEGQTFWLTPERLRTSPSDTERRLVLAVVEDDADAVSAAFAHAVEAQGQGGQTRLSCGMTLVQIGAKTCSPSVVERLVHLGAPLDVLSAWDLGWKDKAAEVARGLDDGAGLDQLQDEAESALLHKAVERDDPALVEMLLAAGASADVKDGRYGSTPAGWAEVLGSHKAGEALKNFREGV